MSDSVEGATAESRPDQHLGELVSRAAEQVTNLVRDELTLAKAEMVRKVSRAGIGLGLFSGGALLLGYAVGVLVVAAVAGLAVVLPVWLAALIIGVTLLAIAGILAGSGRWELRRGAPPGPNETVRSLRDDIEAVRAAVSRRGMVRR